MKAIYEEETHFKSGSTNLGMKAGVFSFSGFDPDFG